MKGVAGRRTCKRCGADRDVSEFPRPRRRGKRDRSTVCRACWNRRRWQRSNWKRRGRRCPRCGVKRACPSQIGVGVTAICKDCRRRTTREYRQMTRKDPVVRERHNETTRRWRRRHPERAAASQRRYRERVMADPEMAKRWREDARIYHRIWRARKGMGQRLLSMEAYRNGNGRPVYSDGYGYLPVGPLLPFVETWLEDGDQLLLSEVTGLHPRRIYAILTGEFPRVRRDTADAICTAIAVPLTLVYPEAA